MSVHSHKCNILSKPSPIDSLHISVHYDITFGRLRQSVTQYDSCCIAEWTVSKANTGARKSGYSLGNRHLILEMFHTCDPNLVPRDPKFSY